MRQIKRQLVNMDDNLTKYKKLFDHLTVTKMRQELADEALERKWKELNMGIDQWKHKYLFPFGNIQPIAATESTTPSMAGPTRGGQQSVQGSHNMSTQIPRPIHPSMDIGFNNPSKQQDSIYSDNMSTYRQYQTQQHLGGGGNMTTINDSLMMDSASLMPN